MMNLNPFPGLRSFEYEESHLFFGRERHINDLLRKLDNNHFVAIVGTSGSGKSSLVRAGLLPAIRQGKLSTDGTEWLITTLKPGNTAVHNLARSLIKPQVFSTGEETADAERLDHTEKILRASRLGLVQAVRGMLPPKKNLLILLDQFEETFRFNEGTMEHNDEDSTQFVNLIIDAVRQRDVPIYVVLTIRSDFLGDCARFEGLPEAINDGHYLVPRLTAEQNKLVITGPVQYAHGKISPRLVQRVVNDLGDNPDQLPVLQHALMRTWDVWTQNASPGEPMDIRHYEMIGGMENALSRHADEAFNELESDHLKKLAEQILKCLTVKTGENRGVRRPTSIQRLMEITGADMEDVLAALLPFRKTGRTFVLPPESVPVTEQSIMDISHESLMRAWERLENWVDEESESAGIYQRLCESAQLNREGKAALWRNPELQMGLDWLKKNQPGEAWAMQYNSQFAEALEFLKKSNQEHLAEKARLNKRRRIIRAAVVTFLIVVSLLTTWALFQTKEARTQSSLAELNRKDAESKAIEAINQKQLAEKAKEIALDASKKALDAKSFAELQSRIAVEQKKLADEQKLKAEMEAHRATEQQQIAVQQRNLADQKSAEALRQKLKADSANAETQRLRLISISQTIAFRSLQEKGDDQLSALLAHQAYLFSKENGGNMNDAQLYNALYNAALRVEPTFKPVAVTENEAIPALVVNGNDITAWLNSNTMKGYSFPNYSVKSQIKFKGFSSGKNTSYLSSNGRFAALGMDNHSIVIYDSKQPETPRQLTGHQGLIRAVVFNQDASLIVSGGRDSSLIFWRNFTLSKKVKCEARIKAVAQAQDGKIYVGCDNGKLYQYNEDGSGMKLMASGNGRVQSVHCQGQWIGVGYSDGLVQLLNRRGTIVRTINESSSVDFIMVDENGDALLTGLSGKRLHLYKVSETGKPIDIQSDQVIQSMDMTDDFIFITCADNTLRCYPRKTSYLEKIVSGNLRRKLSLEEWNTYIGKDVTYRD